MIFSALPETKAITRFGTVQSAALNGIGDLPVSAAGKDQSKPNFY
jgi:hypothetical protein